LIQPVKMRLVPQASKAEIDSDSDAHQCYSEPEAVDVKEEHMLHPPIYSVWKCEIEVSCFECVWVSWANIEYRT
jgi:hypothetical protein